MKNNTFDQKLKDDFLGNYKVENKIFKLHTKNGLSNNDIRKPTSSISISVSLFASNIGAESDEQVERRDQDVKSLEIRWTGSYVGK